MDKLVCFKDRLQYEFNQLRIRRLPRTQYPGTMTPVLWRKMAQFAKNIEGNGGAENGTRTR
jgi:hypothetical protein